MMISGFKLIGIILLYAFTFAFYLGCDNSATMPSACNNIIYAETWGQYMNESKTPIRFGYNATTAMKDICEISKTLGVHVISEQIKFGKLTDENTLNTSTINFALMITLETLLALTIIFQFMWSWDKYRKKTNKYIEIL